MLNRYLNKWFVFQSQGKIRKAQVIDIEFETGVGPLFLMRTSRGNTFWLNRKEIEEYQVKWIQKLPESVPKNLGKKGYITTLDEMN